MKKLFFVLLFISAFFTAWAVELIPTPVQIKYLSADRAVRRVLDVRIDKRADMPQEGYKLTASGNKITIRARTERGRIWAMSTLAQLTDAAGATPEVEIYDYPAYPYRGFMHDTGRNFMEISMLKGHLDLMSAYKLNTFQWHLTDNPGWRIECKAYPELNDAKFHTRDHGKFYTYDQIRDVIKYARERGIEVIPEIDIPGHSAYFERTFGFKMATPEGQKVLEKCFEEFFREIPAKDCPILHIGSDEVKVDQPEQFMEWALALVRASGRQPMAWDPGLPVDSTVLRQVWNDRIEANEEGEHKAGDFVDSYMGYLNFFDPIYFVNKMYHHRVSPRAKGGVLCLWNDVRSDNKEMIELHSGMTPGMLTFAEIFWSNPDVRNFEQFEARLASHRDTLLADRPFYYVSNGGIEWSLVINDTLHFDWRGGAVELDVLCNRNGVKVERTMSCEAKTSIWSDADTTILAWVGFETPARSNRISGGVAEHGKWENDGNVMVNGVRVEPPLRRDAGKYKYGFHTWFTPENELPYTDEQFYWMRPAVEIPLRKGHNTIMMIAPKVFGGQRWNFGFVPLTVVDKAAGRFSEPRGINNHNL